jgi:tRNA pseudouridine55 synthase
MRISGLLIVDKPAGITSLDVVRAVKRRFGVAKAGHIGTLDPFATGVLPVVMNEATKLVPFLEEDPKEYEATLTLGEETTTDDPEGEVRSRRDWTGVTRETLESVFQSFVGRIRQKPPMFSAKKVRGRPLYQLARRGIEVEREDKEVEIYDLRLTGMELPLVTFHVLCSRGTYIRTLARDAGTRIGCGAHLLQLRRLRSGPFSLSQAVSLPELQTLAGEEALCRRFIPMKEALSGWPEMVGDEPLLKKIRFGQEVRIRDFLSEDLLTFQRGQWLKMTSPDEELVAILKSEFTGSELGRMDPDSVAFRTVRVFQPFSFPLPGEGRVGLHLT